MNRYALALRAYARFEHDPRPAARIAAATQVRALLEPGIEQEHRRWALMNYHICCSYLSSAHHLVAGTAHNTEPIER